MGRNEKQLYGHSKYMGLPACDRLIEKGIIRKMLKPTNNNCEEILKAGNHNS